MEDFDTLDLGTTGNGKKVPNEVAVLVLGILSIVGCFIYGVPGLIMGIIALMMHQKDKQVYHSNKKVYEASFKNSNAGYICAIIGTSLSALFILIIIFGVVVGLSR